MKKYVFLKEISPWLDDKPEEVFVWYKEPGDLFYECVKKLIGELEPNQNLVISLEEVDG